MEMDGIAGAHVTPGEARTRVAAAIAERIAAAGVRQAPHPAFEVEAWNDRGSAGGPEHIRLRVARQAAIGESLAHPIRSDLRWSERITVDEAVRDHVHRYARMARRTAAGASTEQSHGDPAWMMTVHRAVAEVAAANGVHVGGRRDWMDLRDAIRACIPMLNIGVDAGRLHPLAMRIARRGEDSRGIYISATTLAADPMTSIVLPYMLPETAMAASAGRRLEDVVRVPGIAGDHVIRRITHSDATGTTIELEHDEIALAPPPGGSDIGWMDSRPRQADNRRLAA